MPHTDLRQYVDKLEEEGELRRVKAEVDWDLEIGAISRRGTSRNPRPPAL